MFHLLPRVLWPGQILSLKKATPQRPAINAPRKPLQVMHISRKPEEEIINEESSEKEFSEQPKDRRFAEKVLAPKEISYLKKAPEQQNSIGKDSSDDFQSETMEDLLRSENNTNYKNNIEAFDDQNIFEQKK